MQILAHTLALFILALPAKAQTVVLEGSYRGSNLYIQNPFDPSGTGSCAQKVIVNGQEVYFKKSTAFEIRLDSLGLTPGQKIKVEITHSPGCLPKLLQDQNHGRRSTYELVSMTVDSIGMLRWKTMNETDKLPFTIEQFRWNKWVEIGEVEGKGGPQPNEYSFQVNLHSGKNLIRVKQAHYSGFFHTPPPVSIASDVPEVELLSGKIDHQIEFSTATMYELYDRSGNLLLKGAAKTIDCSQLREGMYYLNYDNVMTRIKKR